MGPRTTQLFCLLTWTATVFSVGAEALNVTYEGCFSEGLAVSSPYYSLRQWLPWDSGVQVCYRRRTTHLAVQAHHSSHGDYMFFCGNDLLAHSDKLNDSACSPCEDQADRLCGGLASVAIYKIRDYTPLTIIIAETNNLKMVEDVEDGTAKSNTVLSHSAEIVGLAYHFTEDEIFFTSGKTTYRSVYSYFSNKVIGPEKIFQSGYLINSLAIDWVKDLVTYGHEGRYSFELSMLGESIMSARQRVSHTSAVKDNYIDPFKRYYFFLEKSGILYIKDEISSKVKAFNSYGKLYLTNITKFGVDTQRELIYLVGKVRNENGYFLVSMDYNESMVRVLYNSSLLNDVQSIDVFDQDVVWVNYQSGQYFIYTCKLTNRCKTVRTLYQTGEPIRNIKLYHPEKQSPSERYLCQRKNCSHRCERSSLFTVKCVCPPSLTLSSDNRNCIAIPAEIYSTLKDVKDEHLVLDTTKLSSSDNAEKLGNKSQNSEIEYFKNLLRLSINTGGRVGSPGSEITQGITFIMTTQCIIMLLIMFLVGTFIYFYIKVNNVLRPSVKNVRPYELRHLNSSSGEIANLSQRHDLLG